MALLYSYLFPSIFLAAFWAVYRYETPILTRHLGELLTVTVLGGACFGLPTALVSERERGVWRRYRLAPVRTLDLVASTLLARYLLLLTAALAQLALAMAIGMPLPAHPLQLWVAFTLVSFAFLGLGLVIATLADNVPAVQALGQCIFLPMLIIGGVAVKLQSLPGWAQHLSVFFPGRWAVQALQATVDGAGLRETGFAVLALLLIGAAGCVAGGKTFRWDARQRWAAREDRGWLVVALVAWVAVGLLAEQRRLVAPQRAGFADVGGSPALPPAPAASIPQTPAGVLLVSPALSAAERARTVPAPAPLERGAQPTPAVPAAPSAVPDVATRTWRDVTMADIELNLVFAGLPPDDGVVTPIGGSAPAQTPEVACLRGAIPGWAAARVADPVQRVRNHLYIAAAADVLQSPWEADAPLAVFERLQQAIPKAELINILYWIATHPAEGELAAIDDLKAVCLDPSGLDDAAAIRERTTIYAVKLLGRLIGKLPPG